MSTTPPPAWPGTVQQWTERLQQSQGRDGTVAYALPGVHATWSRDGELAAVEVANPRHPGGRPRRLGPYVLFLAGLLVAVVMIFGLGLRDAAILAVGFAVGATPVAIVDLFFFEYRRKLPLEIAGPALERHTEILRAAEHASGLDAVLSAQRETHDVLWLIGERTQSPEWRAGWIDRHEELVENVREALGERQPEPTLWAGGDPDTA